MVSNGKKPENPQNLLVAATLEKANTYVFAESPIRNAEVVGSNPICSTKSLSFNGLASCLKLRTHVAKTWKRFSAADHNGLAIKTERVTLLIYISILTT